MREKSAETEGSVCGKEQASQKVKLFGQLSYMFTYIYCGELFNLAELIPKNLTSEMEIANARIRIHMPKVRS